MAEPQIPPVEPRLPVPEGSPGKAEPYVADFNSVWPLVTIRGVRPGVNGQGSVQLTINNCPAYWGGLWSVTVSDTVPPRRFTAQQISPLQSGYFSGETDVSPGTYQMYLSPLPQTASPGIPVPIPHP